MPPVLRIITVECGLLNGCGGFLVCISKKSLYILKFINQIYMYMKKITIKIILMFIKASYNWILNLSTKNFKIQYFI